MSHSTRPFMRELAYYDDRARGLVAVLGDGSPGAIAQARRWHPALRDAGDDAIRSMARAAHFTLEDARLVFARQHGFEDWDRFADHIRGLASGAPGGPFMDAFEAGRMREWARVAELLREHPELPRALGTNGNSLLNLACSLVATPAPERPSTSPASLERLTPVRILLEAAADVDQGNDRGWTPLHQAVYCNDIELATLLLEAGARIDAEAHGAGGTPLAVALFCGHRDASELLADRGVRPANLRVAAGLGRRDLVDRCFDARGSLTTEARSGRAFYRPHSGFASWHPSDATQEVLDEALVWAAKSGRVAIIPLLVERGADVNASPYQGTPLMWAASNGWSATVEWLLDHGADVNRRAGFGGSDVRGVTALHVAARGGQLAMARLLVERGADVEIEDEIYQATPGGWAEYFGARDVATYLKAVTT